jgi:hypothetical protein
MSTAIGRHTAKEVVAEGGSHSSIESPHCERKLHEWHRCQHRGGEGENGRGTR